MSAYVSIPCPHCGQRARVRSSKGVTALVRELYLICLNDDCAHRFGAQIEITHTIHPSMAPNPAIHLRLTPPALRRAGGNANDNPTIEIMRGGPEVPPGEIANDDDRLGEAVSIGT